jgi:hypothetical protein
MCSLWRGLCLINEHSAEQAGCCALIGLPSDWDDGDYVVSPAQMKKFAESIVRECCDIFVELRTRPADLAVLDVKKHLGVEE